MRENPSSDEDDREGARRALDRAGVLRTPSDLDLMVFFARHPRSLLSSESLSVFLGYDIKDIADSLDVLLSAGILRRRQTSAHAARLYELVIAGSPPGDWLPSLLELAATRRGRLALLDELDRRSRAGPGESGSTQNISRPGPRRITPRPDATKSTKTG